jgi:hypothetical protein
MSRQSPLIHLLTCLLALTLTTWMSGCPSDDDDDSGAVDDDDATSGDDDDATAGDDDDAATDDDDAVDPALSTLSTEWECQGSSNRDASGTITVVIDGVQQGPFAGHFGGGCGPYGAAWSFCDETVQGLNVNFGFTEDDTTIGAALDVIQSGTATTGQPDIVQLRISEVDATLNTIEHPITGGSGMVEALDCASEPASMAGSMTATTDSGESVAITFDFQW